jgi:LysR family glycine cleavage system transcriptional activator
MRALRAFCAAAENESFRLAADDLFLTASAVSHQIRQLESVLGVELFKRSARSLSLTDAGIALADDLRPALEDLDMVIQRNSRVAGQEVLKLSVQPFLANELLVPRLSEFFADNPDISVTVDTSDHDADKIARSADVSIRLFSSPPATDIRDRLFALRLIAVGSPDFYDDVKVVCGRITSRFPLIVHDARPKAWQRWQRSSGITLPGQGKIIRLNSMISIARAAEQGLGAALMPAQLCDARIRSGSLVPLFAHELDYSEAYYLTCSGAVAAQPHVATFRRWLLRELALE